MGMHRSRGSILCTGMMSVAAFAIASAATAVDLNGTSAPAKLEVNLSHVQENVRGDHTVWIDVTDVLGDRVQDAGVSVMLQNGETVRGHTLETGIHYLAGLEGKVTIEVSCPGLSDVQVDLRLPRVVKNANVSIVVDANGLVSMVARPVGPNLAEFSMSSIASAPAPAGGSEGPVCDGTETPEGEPVCGPEYVDNFNGGLNSDPAVFSPIACGESVCGETGNFTLAGLDNRDTDWYLVNLAAQTEVTWTVAAAGFAHAITTVDISVPGGAVVGDFVVSVAGESLTVSNCLAPGDWALFVSTAGFTGVPCGSQYSGSVTCAPCVGPAIGACCNSDGSCTDDVTEDACLAGGGLAFFADDFCFFVSCPDPPEICGPGAGDCFSANGTPGCEDIACCEAVCAADPFCCDTEWDGICAGAALVEPACGAPTEQACCFSDGSCQDLDEGPCADAGGISQGPGTNCAGTICPPPAGPNDECDGAIAIGALPANVIGTTLGQGPDVAPFCGTTDGTGGGVWYTLIGTGNSITLTTCEENPGGGGADYDTKIRIYCSCDGLECVAGNDDGAGCSAFHSSVTFCSQLGAEYRVLVHGFGAAEGNFNMSVTDDGVECSGAVQCIVAPPTGACCFIVGPCGEGECADGLEQADCEGQGGVYQGDDSSCAGSFAGYVVESCGSSFTSIAGVGVLAPNASSSDDDGDLVDIGFSFPFFQSGTTHTQVSVASNGYLTFGTDDSDFTNDPIPNATDPNDLIAPYWEDWSPNVGGDVYTATLNDPLRFMASWEGVVPFGGGDPSDFQAILFPDGTMTFRVGTTDGAQTPVQGIENADGSDGIDTGPPAQNSCTTIVASVADPINCDQPDVDPPMVECSLSETCFNSSSGSSGSHSSSGSSSHSSGYDWSSTSSSGHSGSSSSCKSSDEFDAVNFSASDECGEVTIEAVVVTVCESDGFVITKTVAVLPGQPIDIRCNSADSSSEDVFCSSGVVGGVLTIRADTAFLVVTATDEAGNTATCELDLCAAAGYDESIFGLPTDHKQGTIYNQGSFQWGSE